MNVGYACTIQLSCQGLIVYHLQLHHLFKYLPTLLVGNPIIKILDTPLVRTYIHAYVHISMYHMVDNFCGNKVK